jgi:hypothetical protein
MLPPMTHLVDDSDMDDELLAVMASAPWPSPDLLAADDATYRAAYLPPSLVTQLDDDGDSDLDRTRL